MKKLLLATTVVVALTRLAAISHGIWDWDEALFSLAVREYDVSTHQPHPPGYPLFVAAAKVVHFFGVSEFRSLQVIALLGSFAIFPAAFALAREIGFEFRTAYFGALIYSFFPNVWIYGGGAYSDLPATALLYYGCALVLRGRREPRAYLWGAVLLALCAAIRPQHLLVAIVPVAMGTIARLRVSWKPVLAAALAALLIIGVIYTAAFVASASYADVRKAMVGQREWLAKVDSYQNPARPPLAQLGRLFFFKPVQNIRLMLAIDIIAAIGFVAAFVRRRWQVLRVFAFFGPFAVVAWLNFDFSVVGRYSIVYIFAHALLAADGLAAIALTLKRAQLAVQGVLSAALALVLIVWTFPALRTLQAVAPPPAGAFEWVRQNVPEKAPLFVTSNLWPHGTYLLHGRDIHWVENAGEVSALTLGGYLVQPQLVPHPGAHSFVMPRRRLWEIVRPRHFEASVTPISTILRFGDGWHLEEGEGTSTWRWMGYESVTYLPAVRKDGKLSIRYYVPLDGLATPPTVQVILNGRVIDSIVSPEADVERTYTVKARSDAENELRLRTSAVVNQVRDRTGSDSRDLGLRVNMLSWSDTQP
ncbi:MAG TPA: hypothetical protein VGF69_15945 [Thermoanaerobaculia bacterium]|jgi:4-amino-4-deoxy-L-arabinose transferase-like glycosyltransferase